MIARLAAGARRFLGMHRPGRNLDVFPDDVFIVSYPKSGNTWTRFLVANLAYPEQPANFANINHLTPDPEGLSKRQLSRMRRPRLIKSHQYFDPRYPRVIYIVRDPRDVAVSQYHFHRKRRLIEDDFPVERFVTNFVAGSTSIYGSWGENVASWVATRFGRPSFLLMRYEDMIAHTQQELSRVAAFLEIDADMERLSRAVDLSSAERMREMEAAQATSWSSTKDTRQDVPFVRSAKAGGWKASLPESAVAELESAWGPLMRWLGYELAVRTQFDEASASVTHSLLGAPVR